MDSWGSASRGLFIAMGAVWLLIGLLTPFFVNRGPGLFISYRTDRERYGVDPHEAFQNQTVRGVRESAVLSLAGMLVVGGGLAVAIAWFALPTGQAWPLWSLAASGALALLYWILVLRPYWAAGIYPTLGEIPPFMWVTTALWILATTAGLVARRTA